MNATPFADLPMSDEVRRAVTSMGFENATEIQAQSIPLLREGKDIIGRSQTGTGKTLAFGIPAIEAVDAESDAKNNVQILILCPTRELAVQACLELKKLALYKQGVRVTDVYGGAPMERQIMQLKRANIVVGTPGRVMDHMRRKTLRLEHLKMIILDEADEMLSMGFREDIETILQDTPADRQTVLFSATMPPAILALTKQYQNSPQLVAVRSKQVTVESIDQSYYEVPMGRKMDALNLILRFHRPTRAMIFCNTKKMVDEILEYLTKNGFSAEGIHGDLKQSQRTKVMDAFKAGKTTILIATDVAARGIDVNDIDYVINYDVPQNGEYYVHRIGRTGRAGKSGKAVTICSGRRQVQELLELGRLCKSEIHRAELPNGEEIAARKFEDTLGQIEEKIRASTELPYSAAMEELAGRGYDPAVVAAAVMELHFGPIRPEVEEIRKVDSCAHAAVNPGGRYQKISINIGRADKVAPNHIVGAITEKTHLSGRDIGKIEIYDDNTLVSIPASELTQTLEEMKNCRINRKMTVTTLYNPPARTNRYHSGTRRPYASKRG